MASFRMGFWGYPHVRTPPQLVIKTPGISIKASGCWVPSTSAVLCSPSAQPLPPRRRLRAVPVGRSYGARAQPQQLWWTQVGYGWIWWWDQMGWVFMDRTGGSGASDMLRKKRIMWVIIWVKYSGQVSVAESDGQMIASGKVDGIVSR